MGDEGDEVLGSGDWVLGKSFPNYQLPITNYQSPNYQNSRQILTYYPNLDSYGKAHYL
ncbi:hypothetical protein Anacy_5552 [Anabaena cylindrica PCC 7122]|uniref:Uncharacterized protein n=1 Tax=Anabaena cylindrica (strain ATCC 27899 / PCC 7122) TaxID=272123 RepID=K9ZPY9_ANACC|nr:hypothetical protein Anacy_5552 [Anabaena cylindrica PCC 7122]BAY02043.1 hypothetical protein NIES19_12800 [Anabaena cylindrica PCC 7122]